MERERGGGEFKTNLEGNGNAETVVGAMAKVQATTNEPTKVGGTEFVAPLVNAGEINVVVFTAVETEVNFQTVGSAKCSLVGDFSTVGGTTTQTDTDCVLCIGCKTEGDDGHQKNQYFLHNEM